MLAALGVDIDRLFAVTFAVGAALAGLAGVIAAPVFGSIPGWTVDYLIYSSSSLSSWPGNAVGPVAGSALIGPAGHVGKVLFPQFALARIFAIMALVLLLATDGVARPDPHRPMSHRAIPAPSDAGSTRGWSRGRRDRGARPLRDRPVAKGDAVGILGGA